MKTESTSWWSTLETLDTTLGVVLALVAIVGYGLALRNWLRFKDLTKTQARVEQRAASLLVDLDRAEKENAQLARTRDEWMPKAWLKEADKEVASGNDIRATDILDQGYQRVREDLARVILRLSQYHAALSVGENPAEELEAARALCRIAQGLAPHLKKALQLSEELNSTVSVDAQIFKIPVREALPSDPESAQTLIMKLLESSEFHLRRGRYKISLLLCERAERISRHAGLSQTIIGATAKHKLAERCMLTGNYQIAWETVNGLLDLREQILEPNHLDTHNTRRLEADILYCLGREQEGLFKIGKAIELAENSLGNDHLLTLFMKSDSAQFLAKLGLFDDSAEVLDNIVTLVYNRHEKCIDSHSRLLLKCSEVYSTVGHSAKAKEILNEIIPRMEKLLGQEHPQTQAAQTLRNELTKRTYL
ncbi:hypothetical protein [Citromicrobium sp. WPS32]|uniref:hypothetical protein n=1 Tax=Citromicrobium sp. WPS32 TaxID=1634517 RepID=UPI0006C92E34|nr:hypothetical protein [Citromicrobium sp. WPS32]KPM12802.1 hypothetical protein WG75_13895 [Citromicrobium sp. WPS32]MAY78414.1 hypothetical protein [Citromicrobium sp.]|tara:strand:- start:4873 stop:6138 length:1266 start_codon:yes stop_codon:yes gene_type:complete